MFGLRKPRTIDVRPSCEPETFVRQIEDYIRQARAHAELATEEELREALGVAPSMPHEFTQDIRLVRAQAVLDAKSIGSSCSSGQGLVRPAIAAGSAAIIVTSSPAAGRPSCRGEPRSRWWTSPNAACLSKRRRG